MNITAFRDKVAIVTGGASGIGAATVRQFVAAGAKVLIADVQADAAAELAAQLGDAACARRCDVSDYAQVEAAVAAAVERFGGVDVLVNNAGIEVAGPLSECTADVFNHCFSINVLGVVNGIRAVTPHLLARGGGAIVNTASIAGLSGTAMMGPYSASKAAVISLTQTAALELRAHDVRVNCVCPGFIQTPMLGRIGATVEAMLGARLDELATIKQGRFGKPEEIAAAIIYLASSDAPFVTGVALPVDNALSLGML